MVGARTVTAAVGLLASILVSVAVWYYFDTVLVFLVLPFVPLLWRRGQSSVPPERTCPTCGFSTRDVGFEYCPRDGTPLERE